MRAAEGRNKMPLRDRLEETCSKGGAVAFGIASSKAIDALPRVKIGWTINKYTVKLDSVMPGAKSVIAFGIPSLDDSDELEIDRGNGNYTYPGYLSIKVLYRDIIRILNEEGYKAHWLNEDESTTSYKRIAVLAGIGSFGKNSLILSPKFGPWLRIGLVLTDASLKLSKSFEKDLCGDCNRCTRACPAGAISEYKVSPEKCLVGVATQEDSPEELKALLDKYEPRITPRTRVMCRVCQMACPYTPRERRSGSLAR